MRKKEPAAPAITAAELRYTLALAVDPKDAARLKRGRLLHGGHPTQQRVTSVYYDTRDLALKRRSWALSIRKEGQGALETLETVFTPSSAIVERPMWQTVLARPMPDLKPLARVDGLEDLSSEPLKLRRLFTCHFLRSQSVLEPDGAVVTVSFDEGEIRTSDGRKSPVSEIEIELQQGTPRAVFKLANALADQVPLRLELRSRATRGYALAERTEPRRPTATGGFGQVELRRSMTTEDALSSILKRCLAHLLANERAASASIEEGIHQMRVALRRLRVAIGLFTPMLPETERNWVVGEVKWLTSTLGRARNWDVLANTIRCMRDSLTNDHDLAALARAVERERRLAHVALHTALNARRYTQLTLDLMGWIETRGWRRPGALETSILQASRLGKLADEVLEQRYRKSRRRARNFDRLGPVGRHRLRIALKKMRYAADSFASIYPKKAVRRYVKRLVTLQDNLGMLNDIATSEHLLHGLIQRRSSPAINRGAMLVRGWCAHVASDTEPRLQKGLTRLKKAEPFWRRLVTS